MLTLPTTMRAAAIATFVDAAAPRLSALLTTAGLATAAVELDVLKGPRGPFPSIELIDVTLPASATSPARPLCLAERTAIRDAVGQVLPSSGRNVHFWTTGHDGARSYSIVDAVDDGSSGLDRGAQAEAGTALTARLAAALATLPPLPAPPARRTAATAAAPTSVAQSAALASA